MYIPPQTDRPLLTERSFRDNVGTSTDSCTFMRMGTVANHELLGILDIIKCLQILSGIEATDESE